MGAGLVGPAGLHTIQFGDSNGTAFADMDSATVSAVTFNSTLYLFAICTSPLPGLHLVTKAGPESPVDIRSSTATCPSGEVVLGGFAVVNSFGGEHEFVQGSVPDLTTNSVTVTAAHDPEATFDFWTLDAVAVCAKPIPGLSLVRATLTSDRETDFATVTARCASGKHVLGTGFSVDVVPGRFVMDDVRPNVALTAVTVSAAGTENWTTTPADWHLSAYAVCAS